MRRSRYQRVWRATRSNWGHCVGVTMGAFDHSISEIGWREHSTWACCRDSGMGTWHWGWSRSGASSQ